MIFNFITHWYFIVGLILLIPATITDIKRKEVPDKISFSLIIFGILLNLYYFLFKEWNFNNLITLLFVFLITLIGYLLYKLRQWGGADVKLILGIGLIYSITNYTNYSSFLIDFLIYSSIYSIIATFFNIFQHFELYKKNYFNLKNSQKKLFWILLILPLITIIKPLISIFSFLVFLSYFLKIFKESVTDSMKQKRDVDLLVDGEWLFESIRYKNKILIDYEKKKMLSQNDINFLKSKGVKSINIIEGFAFVPAILLSYFMNIFFKNTGYEILSFFIMVLI